MGPEVSRRDVIAFRLNAHHLDQRLEDAGLLEAAGSAGVQNSPPGSALLALHARVHNLTRERFDEAVAGEKSLLQTWSMRGAPHFFPTADAPVFTTGVLPPTEDAIRHFIPGVEQALAELGMSVAGAVELTGAQIPAVLSGRRLAIDELGRQVAQRIARLLPAGQRETWERVGPYAPDQPLGEGVVHFCLRILTLQRVVCFARRAANTAPFALVDEWLGRPIPDVDPAAARSELLRRYLRCYGPSTRAHFAAWVGVSADDTDPWWTPLSAELTQVEYRGKAWLLTEDLHALRAPTETHGVRMLPPHDPYTQMCDRGTILDERHHREVWKPVGVPGTFLADGEIIGIWRARKSGRKLTITVKAFQPLPTRHEKPLDSEAEQVALLRGASSVDVSFSSS